MSIKIPPTNLIEEKSFLKAWERQVRFCNNFGVILPAVEKVKEDEKVIMTKDINSIIVLTKNAIQEIIDGKLHPDFPTKEKFLQKYKEQVTCNYAINHKKLPIKDQFEYLYIERLTGCTSEEFEKITNQLEVMLEQLEKYGINRRTQAITWIPEIDLYNDDSPCFDIETEVLTKEGWKLFKNITYKDSIMTLNENKNLIEYHNPINLVSSNYNGEMFSYNGSNANFMVTPNHNMYIGYQNKKFELNRVDSLTTEFYIKSHANWIGKEKEFIYLGKNNRHKKIKMDNFLKYLAIYLNDGDAYENNGRYRVRISKKINKEKYKKIINDLHPDYNVIEEQDKNCNECTQYIINNKELTKYMLQFGKAKDKFIPNFIKNLSERQINIFLEARKLGDFHKNGSTNRYCSISKKMTDDLQELIIKNGFETTSNIWSRKDKEYYELKEQNLKYGNFISPKLIQKIQYNNMVYCVEVPNNIIMVRRKGQTMWCGNCLQRLWVRPLKEDSNNNQKISIELHLTWRSRDGYKAWMSNEIAILFMMYKYVFKNKYEVVKIVDFCNSFHIYEDDWDIVKDIRILPVNLL